MKNRIYKKIMGWIGVLMIVCSLLLWHVTSVYAAGESAAKSSEIAIYTSEDSDEYDEEDGDEEDGDEEDGEDEDDSEPQELSFVRVASVEYNTNNGTVPIYNAKVVDGGAVVAFEGWVGSDQTNSYSTYAAYGDFDNIFETFKEGIKYTYSIRLAVKKGYIFADTVRVQLNNETFTATANSTHKMITLRDVYTKESICEHAMVKKVKKATCVEGGYTTYTCKYCGYSYTTDYVNAGGHQWETTADDLTTADDEEDGEIGYTCAICGAEKTIVIPRIKTVTLSTTKYTYNGTEKKPSVKAVDAKGQTIPSSTYTVKYSNNKNAGTGTVTVVFKGKYDAEIEKNFTISQASQSISAAVTSKTYKKATVAKKAQTFSIKAAAKTSLSYKSSSKYVTVSSKGTVTVKKGTPKGTYKITVSAKKSTNYKAATKTVTVKVS